MIKHVGSKWVLFTKDGSRRLGTHDTEDEAIKQERAIEASKHRAAGDNPGHEFHGNQYTTAREASIQASAASDKADRTGTSVDNQKAADAHELARSLHQDYGSKVSATQHEAAYQMHTRRAIKLVARGLSGAELRQLHLRGALGAVRTETIDGHEHLVVPCVALQEGVIHAINAETPEFVSAAALSKNYTHWNGHPLVLGHPTRDGRQISAHDPDVLARHGFGHVRASRMNGGRLGMEALVDPERLVALKQDQLLADLRAGKQVEVSVGAFVTTNDRSGTHKGRAYKAEWVGITPDHLAFLPNGTGACSLEMGCGAHRAAVAHLVTAEGFEALEEVGHPFHGNQYTDGDGTASRDNPGERRGTGNLGSKTGRFTNDAAGNLAGHQALAAQQHVNKLMDKMTPAQSASFDKKLADHEKLIGDKSVSDRDLQLATRELLYQAHQAVGRSNQNAMASSREVEQKAVKSFDKEIRLRGGKQKGLSMKNLKARILALFDTPEQAASEEAAELVRFDTLRATCDAIGDSWDEVDALVDELIEAEAMHATGGAEESETELEVAKLDAIRTYCLAMSGALGAMMNLTYPPPHGVEPGRYAEALRVAAGARNSKSDMKTIQGIHDHAADLGARCDAQNVRFMAAKVKECVACEGTGQIKTGDKQADCEACNGTGELKAAEQKPCSCGGRTAEGDADMTRADRIAALIKHEHNPIKDQKALEANTDEGLRLLEVHCENAATLKAASDKLAAEKAASDKKAADAEAALKAASEKQLTEEEFLKTAPESIRTLVTDKKVQDEAQKKSLVGQLKAASTVLTEEQLNAKTLDELKILAQFAKIAEPAADYSGRGAAVPRNAGDVVDYTPPDSYAPGIKALQEASKAVN